MASAITYEMVEKACNDLQAAGEKVTYLKIHEHLGQGSTRIVTAHMRRWREAHMTAARAGEDLLFQEWPEALKLRAKSLFDALREVSADAATACIETAQAQMALKEAELRTCVVDAEVQREQALDQLRSEQANSSRLQAELESVRETLDVQRATIDDLLGQRERMVASESALKEHLESVQREHEGHIRELGEQTRIERERLIDEVRKEQERAAGEREHLMRQTDRLRQDYATQVQEFRGKLLAIETKEIKTREQLAEANGLNRERLATIRQFETRVAELSASVEKLQAEAGTLAQTRTGDTARLYALEMQLVLQEKALSRETERANRAEERLQQVTLQRIQAQDSTPDV